MHQCNHGIVEVYKLNLLAQTGIASRVNEPLFQDRFICREDGRDVSIISLPASDNLLLR